MNGEFCVGVFLPYSGVGRHAQNGSQDLKLLLPGTQRHSKQNTLNQNAKIWSNVEFFLLWISFSTGDSA